MKVIFKRESPNIIWEILNAAMELDVTVVLSLRDSYFLESSKDRKSNDITGSMLTLHYLCGSSYPATNLFCLFQKFDVSFKEYLVFCKDKKSVAFGKDNTIYVASSKGGKTFSAFDPDTFGALQYYLH